MIFPCVRHANTKIQINKYTNTQIQHIVRCQKQPICCIFLKRGLFKDIKNDIPMCQTRKYKNTNRFVILLLNTGFLPFIFATPVKCDTRASLGRQEIEDLLDHRNICYSSHFRRLLVTNFCDDVRSLIHLHFIPLMVFFRGGAYFLVINFGDTFFRAWASYQASLHKKTLIPPQRR